jgi:hypothetical protein
VNTARRPVLSGILLALCLAACGKGSTVDEGAEAAKKAHAAAITALKQPIAAISAYAPYAKYPEGTDKYAPARHSDLDKYTECAANEIRFAANTARQRLEMDSDPATKDLQAALKAVSQACADANEPGALAKCTAAVAALDASLDKTGAAAAALGVAGKYPRVAPDAVTDEARAAIAPFLRAKGPGDNEKAYVVKRADPSASVADVQAACAAADGDAATAMSAFEKADEPIRLVAVTRKLALDSQCRRLDEIQGLSKDVADCHKGKKAKTSECKIVCGKAKNALEVGLPAAVFAPLEKDVADICKD